MKSIVTRFTATLATALIAGATLFAATNVAAQEVVKPPESAKVLPLADFKKKLETANDSNVDGTRGVYLRSSRSGSIYKIDISKIDGVLYFSGTGGSGSNSGADIVITGTEDTETLCVKSRSSRDETTCLRYSTDNNDYYLELVTTNSRTGIITKRFDKKPDPKAFNLVK